MNKRFLATIAMLLFALSALPAWAQSDGGVGNGPTPSPAAKPKPTPVVKEKPAIDIFRVTFDSPGHTRSGGGGRGWGWGTGPPYEKATGVVWFSNSSNDTLTDVVLTIEFYNTQYYRSEGSKVYPIGKLDTRQSESVNYRWDNWQGAPVVPKVRMTYRKAGGDQVYTVRWDGYGY